MPVSDVHYILCPGCESSVHELTATRCPHCHRCSLCGQKILSDDAACDCGTIEDPARAESFLRKFEVRSEDVPRERRRIEIRKQLANRKVLISTVVSSLVSVLVSIIYREWFGRPVMLRELICLGTVIAFLALIATILVYRLFTRIESQQLDIEFPGREVMGDYR